jgi:hypothetical protein
LGGPNVYLRLSAFLAAALAIAWYGVCVDIDDEKRMQ